MGDEVDDAIYSNDLPRMLRALEYPADPVARHFLLQHIVEHTYKLRHDDPNMRELCERVGRQHLSEFGAIATAFKAEPGGLPPVVPSFRALATVLAENCNYDDAVKVCETAVSFGAGDGTASGFQGRIERIRNQQQAHAEGRAKPAARRPSRARLPEDVRAERSNVPRFKCYFATTGDMNANQREFYDRWCASWEAGTSLPVDGNISYLFCYTYSVLALGPSEAIIELNRLIQAYRDSEPRFAAYCQSWVSDCYILEGNLEKSLEMQPHTDVDVKERHAAKCDHILSLKLAMGRRADGRDMLALQTPQVSKWTREHLESVLKHCDAILERLHGESGTNVLQEWAKAAHSYPLSAFAGSSFRRDTKICAYSFSDHKPARAFARSIVHEAENAARSELGLPPVREQRRTGDQV